uniref:Uncharacterized protein n=1 Tax=Heliothis virescens TaxID=7102 RepID=A0A2A4IWK5_HELVI
MLPAFSDTDSKLSMYSLDTLRLNLNSKSIGSKDNHTKISVPNRLVTLVANAAAERNAMGSIPRSRRPLMRDPHAGRPRAPKPTRETDIRTMVEGVETVHFDVLELKM